MKFACEKKTLSLPFNTQEEFCLRRKIKMEKRTICKKPVESMDTVEEKLPWPSTGISVASSRCAEKLTAKSHPFIKLSKVWRGELRFFPVKRTI